MTRGAPCIEYHTQVGMEGWARWGEGPYVIDGLRPSGQESVFSSGRSRPRSQHRPPQTRSGTSLIIIEKLKKYYKANYHIF